MRTYFYILALTLLSVWTVLGDGTPMREATPAEVEAGTIGFPAVITPRRQLGNTNALSAAQAATLANAVTNNSGTNNSGSALNTFQFGGYGNTVFNLNTGYVSGADDSAALVAMFNYANTNQVNFHRIDLMGRNWLLNTNLLYTNQVGFYMFNGTIVVTNQNLNPAITLAGDYPRMFQVNIYGPGITNYSGNSCGLLLQGPVLNYIEDPEIVQCRIQNFSTNVVANHTVGGIFLDDIIIAPEWTCLDIAADQTLIEGGVYGEADASHYGFDYGPGNAPYVCTNAIAIKNDGGISLTVQHINANTVHTVFYGGCQTVVLDDINTENCFGLTNDPCLFLTNCASATIKNCTINPNFTSGLGSNGMIFAECAKCQFSNVTFENNHTAQATKIIEMTNSSNGSVGPKLLSMDGGWTVWAGANSITNTQSIETYMDTVNFANAVIFGLTNVNEVDIGGQLHTSAVALTSYYGHGYISCPQNDFKVVGSDGSTVMLYVNNGQVTAENGFYGSGKALTNILHSTTSVATSGTVTAATSYQSETTYLSSSSTIVALTVALPTTTVVGQEFIIHTKSAITTLTVTGGAFADTAITTEPAGGTTIYQAVDTAGTYIKLD